jgi:hypothetical protein
MKDNTAFPEISPLGMSRTHDPDTSKEAASKVNVNQREQDVLDALASLGGDGTCDEVTELCAMVYKRDEVPSNFSPRIAQLRSKGLIADTDKTRKSRQGRAQKVVRLTFEGMERAKAFVEVLK